MSTKIPYLTAKGYDCAVVAPSRIPKKSGDRIQNDRRDACTLARLDRAGELTSVYVPLAEDEAIRDLTRAREVAKIDEKKSRQRLLSFLLRSGFRYTGKSSWSKAHMRWLADIKMPHPMVCGSSRPKTSSRWTLVAQPVTRFNSL